MLLAVAAAGCSRAQGPSLAPALLQVLSADGLPGPTRTCNEAPSPGPRLAGRFHENESCSVVSDSLRPHGLHGPWDSPGQNTGVGSLSLLQGIFPTQGSNPGLLHWRWILHHVSHKVSPRILEWAAFPFSRGSSRPRDRTRVSRIAGGSFTS